MSADLQLLVFDTRRGNVEGREDDKLLAFHPAGTPVVQQAGVAGLLQGLLLFTATFTATPRPHWDVAETDSGIWVMHEPEPHIWFALLAPKAWMPRHATEAGLKSLLAQAHLLCGALCGSVQQLLDRDPSGGLARHALGGVLQRLGAQLGNPHSWQHRELRNPLADIGLPQLLPLPPGGAMAVQSLVNQLLAAALPAGQGQGRVRPVRGVLLLYGPHLLWSSLPPRDTAALFALVATGLLHASASSSGGGANSGGAASPGPLDLRALDGGGWQQLPSGFLALRGGLDAAITAASAQAVDVPLVHLCLAGGAGPPADGLGQGSQGQEPTQLQQQERAGDAGGGLPPATQPFHLLPLLEGRLLVGLLLDAGTQLSSHLLQALHGLLLAPAKRLAAQVAEELRAGKVEEGHLPGFRYLYRDPGQAAVRASPRAKVSAMTHHARALAAAVRDSLGRSAGGELSQWGEQQGAAGEAASDGGSPAAPDTAALQGSQQSGGTGGPGDHEVLEVLSKSSQDCWAAAWREGPGGRSLLAVRERKAEREVGEAAGVMRAFAEANFLM